MCRVLLCRAAVVCLAVGRLPGGRCWVCPLVVFEASGRPFLAVGTAMTDATGAECCYAAALEVDTLDMLSCSSNTPTVLSGRVGVGVGVGVSVSVSVW